MRELNMDNIKKFLAAYKITLKQINNYFKNNKHACSDKIENIEYICNKYMVDKNDKDVILPTIYREMQKSSSELEMYGIYRQNEEIITDFINDCEKLNIIPKIEISGKVL